MTETVIPNLTFDETPRLMAEGAQWLPGGAAATIGWARRPSCSTAARARCSTTSTATA